MVSTCCSAEQLSPSQEEFSIFNYIKETSATSTRTIFQASLSPRYCIPGQIIFGLTRERLLWKVTHVSLTDYQYSVYSAEWKE